MSDAPSSHINWADYLGVNQDAADELLKKLTGSLEGQGEALQLQQRRALVNAEGPSESYGESLLSYTDAVERLRDPATRQAVMQKQFGAGSPLDSALVGAREKGEFDRLAEGAKRTIQGDARMQEELPERIAGRQRGFKQVQEENERRVAEIEALKKSKAEAKEKHKKFLEAMEADKWGEKMFAGNPFTRYDPNAQYKHHGLFGTSLTHRDVARAQLSHFKTYSAAQQAAQKRMAEEEAKRKAAGPQRGKWFWET